MATSVQYLYQMIFFLVCNNLLIRLGGETAVAVFDVIQNTSYLILYLFEGTGRAMAAHPLHLSGRAQPAGNAEHGASRLHGGTDGGRRADRPCGAVARGNVPAVRHRRFGVGGAGVYRAAALRRRGALFAGINILLCNYYQACENEKPSFLLETLRGAVLLIPLTFVCYAFGLQRFWLLFLLTEAGSLAVFLLLGLGGRYKKAELRRSASSSGRSSATRRM